MCNWESKDKQRKCDRESLSDSEFCLFHKQNKDEKEAALFWKIINFNVFSNRLIELNELQYTQNGVDSSYSPLITVERDKIEESNFTSLEKSKPDFIDYKKSIVKLYYDSKISGKGNMTLPDFYGFIFPNVDVHNFQFSYKYNPYSDGSLHFVEVVFEGFMNFSNFNFIGSTQFINCDFKNGVCFTNSTFNNNVKFKNSNLSTGYTVYGMGMFQNTKFLGREVVFDNVTGLLEFNSLFSENTDFRLLNMHYGKDFGTASFGEKAYRTAKIQSNRIGDYNSATNYYYLEKCYRGYQILPKPYFWSKNEKWFKKIQFFNYIKHDRPHKKVIPKIIDLVFKHTLGYGEKPLKALKTTLILIILFAILYFYIGDISCKTISNNDSIINYDLYFGKELFSLNNWIIALKDFGNCIYFSTVTFTTVGYGDITPTSGISKLLSGLEMFLGVTFIGAWTATLLRKIIN